MTRKEMLDALYEDEAYTLSTFSAEDIETVLREHEIFDGVDDDTLANICAVRFETDTGKS